MPAGFSGRRWLGSAVLPSSFLPLPFPVASCVHRLLAVGRDACTSDLGLDRAGVTVDSHSGKIPVVAEQTNVPCIYAIGDVLESRQVGRHAGAPSPFPLLMEILLPLNAMKPKPTSLNCSRF